MPERRSLQGLYQQHSYPSYSQCGEDRIAFYYFGERPIFYVDIGASVPCGHNNTYLFYEAGGRGILVEAEHEYHQAYSALRPRDNALEVAVVPEKMNVGQVRFYQTADQGWSTVDINHLEIARENGKSAIDDTSVVVPTMCINDILELATKETGGGGLTFCQ